MTSTDVMRTDADWEHFASKDPYWAVLTADEFKQQNLDDQARSQFFASGEAEADKVFGIVRRFLDPAFAPRRVLDFGCGVGRILIPLARRCEVAVGVDVSETMLRETAANARAAGVENIELVKGDDTLSGVTGTYDLVNALMVLQHIPVERGVRIFKRLVELVGPGGCGSLQVTYDLPQPPPAPPPPPPPRRGLLRSVARTVLAPLRGRPTPPPAPVVTEPVMQMNVYTLNPLLRAIHVAGVRWTHIEVLEIDNHSWAQFFFRRPLPV